MTLHPDRPGLPALVTAAEGDAAIRLTGAGLRVTRRVRPTRGIRFTGVGGVFRWGAVAEAVRVLGAANQFVVDEACFLS